MQYPPQFPQYPSPDGNPPPPFGAPPPGPPGAGDPYAAPRTHPLAVASMICGILSVPACCCWALALPLEIAALVCGFLALARIRAEPYAFTGKGMCIAGIACAAFGLLFSVAWFAGHVRDSIRSRYGVEI